MIVYLLYRRSQGLDLISTHKVAIPQPVVDHEAEYDSVLVPLGDHYDESVVATAAKLAARKRRGIHILALVTVPSALKIDAPMPEAMAAAESLIEQARLQAGARVSGHVESQGAASTKPLSIGTFYIERADGTQSKFLSLLLGRIDQQGRFSTQGQPAGKYFVRGLMAGSVKG